MLSAKNTASADGKTRVPKREREKGRNSVRMGGESRGREGEGELERKKVGKGRERKRL